MDILISFVTLTALEIVLGIDNIIFISILVARLPKEVQEKARKIGLVLALVFRVGLLFCLSWIAGLVEPLFSVFEKGFSGRDLILLFGGLFLIAKSTLEIHEKLEGDEEILHGAPKKVSFNSVIAQVIVLDIVFSLDSVITAVGLAQKLPVMIAAVVASVLVMLATANKVSEFIEKHPTVKMLALSFLLLVGFTLVAEGWGAHVSKGYIYFAMAFSVFVEFLNIKLKSKRKHSAPVHLRR